MNNASDDVHIFNEANIHKQLKTAPFTKGFYTLTFYTEQGKPANHRTDAISEFYLYPSGGTLRDSTFNLVFYDSQFDTYRGFKPPHLAKSGE